MMVCGDIYQQHQFSSISPSVSPSGVTSIIRELNVRKSGHDKVPNKAILCLPMKVTNHLTKIFNKRSIMLFPNFMEVCLHHYYFQTRSRPKFRSKLQTDKFPKFYD
ncbi:hypothetical protein CDAR_399531 [Caerostris darwini]|uniref:Maturase K n=1 Tax=Caerostris darwini TaxID=1538125 RepID=A0AAV4SXB2_9ARAC|nr:hypothetical protein CDAR_399531 [Caerostris darwini]